VGLLKRKIVCVRKCVEKVTACVHPDVCERERERRERENEWEWERATCVCVCVREREKCESLKNESGKA